MPYIANQYKSSEAFVNTAELKNVVDPDDKARIRTYTLFEDMYYNRPETFSVTLRGDSDVEIYLPSVKKMVDATARYLAVDFNFTVDPNGKTAAKKDVVTKAFQDLFDREKVVAQFIQQKKSCLFKGDQVWMILADDTKEQGVRLTVTAINPDTYFPIENDEGKISGVHIVDTIHDPRDTTNDKTKLVARRQTYRRTEDANGKLTKQITYEEGLYEIGTWDDRSLKPDQIKKISTTVQLKNLPSTIQAIPVYHIPNSPPNGSTWGISQVSGIEYCINALNQSITYEDLTLILQGLGVYVSTAGPPVDQQTQQPTTYNLRPGNVVEIGENQDFRRVSGISDVSPYQAHMDYIDKFCREALGIPEMATGLVDVTVAESGIALALQMGPIIAECADKQLEIISVWNQILFDLANYWFPEYEGIASSGVEVKAVVGDPLPINREKFIQELMLLFTSGVITIEMVQEQLAKLGPYKFAAGDAQKALEQQAIIAGAGQDQFGAESGFDQTGQEVLA